jgi:hypothetical protein
MLVAAARTVVALEGVHTVVVADQTVAAAWEEGHVVVAAVVVHTVAALEAVRTVAAAAEAATVDHIAAADYTQVVERTAIHIGFHIPHFAAVPTGP